jgi:hypothetical protein
MTLVELTTMKIGCDIQFLIQSHLLGDERWYTNHIMFALFAFWASGTYCRKYPSLFDLSCPPQKNQVGLLSNCVIERTGAPLRR